VIHKNTYTYKNISVVEFKNTKMCEKYLKNVIILIQ